MKNKVKDCLKLVVACVFGSLMCRYFFSIAVYIVSEKWHSPSYLISRAMRTGDYIVVVFMILSIFYVVYAIFKLLEVVLIFIGNKKESE